MPDLLRAQGSAHPRHGNHESAQFINRVEGFLERRVALNI